MLNSQKIIKTMSTLHFETPLAAKSSLSIKMVLFSLYCVKLFLKKVQGWGQVQVLGTCT